MQDEIDLYSDTHSLPGKAMRQAMAEAEVGDEYAGEDPTVNRLCESVADLLGKEAAVYLPSGTMCNEISYCVHCRPGDEVILDRTCHTVLVEAGGPAALAGAMIRTIDGERGQFTGEHVREAIRPNWPNMPRSRLLSIENTSNFGGGSIWSIEQVREVTEVAREHGMATHLDGARLMNAVIAGGTPAADYAACFDSLWIDFSKGLGAPVGAVLAGSKAFIDEAWRFKYRFGGAMRQAGIIAAGALYALNHNVERLADDHANARRLADGLAAIDGISLDPASVETNLVFFDVAGTGRSAGDLAAALRARGVRIGDMGPTVLRAVTYLDVDADDVERALVIVREVVAD